MKIETKNRRTVVNITPTWRALLPVLLDLARNPKLEVREHARAELAHMADAADRWNAEMPPMLAAANNARNVLAGLATGVLKGVKRDSPAGRGLRAAIKKTENGGH